MMDSFDARELLARSLSSCWSRSMGAVRSETTVRGVVRCAMAAAEVGGDLRATA
jgi:hypothetical protein